MWILKVIVLLCFTTFVPMYNLRKYIVFLTLSWTFHSFVLSETFMAFKYIIAVTFPQLHSLLWEKCELFSLFTFGYTTIFFSLLCFNSSQGRVKPLWLAALVMFMLKSLTLNDWMSLMSRRRTYLTWLHSLLKIPDWVRVFFNQWYVVGYFLVIEIKKSGKCYIYNYFHQWEIIVFFILFCIYF
jgi:hypothetical protein